MSCCVSLTQMCSLVSSRLTLIALYQELAGQNECNPVNYEHLHAGTEQVGWAHTHEIIFIVIVIIIVASMVIFVIIIRF